MRRALAIAFASFLGATRVASAGGVADDPSRSDERLEAELAAARRTRASIAEKLATREAELRGRVRALYKLVRGGTLPLWVDEGERIELLRRRAAARRLILRDLAERRALMSELRAAEADEARLLAEKAARAAEAGPPPWPSLVPPVPGRILVPYGPRRDPGTRARLVHRGLLLAAGRGERVRAPGDGRVRYAGPLRGLGQVVVVEHGRGVVSVVAGLAIAEVGTGHPVRRGEPIGLAASDHVYVELRVAGRPVDPTPVLRSPR